MSVAVTDRERSVVEGVPKKLYIGGEWIDAAEGATLAVEDPSTREKIAEAADPTPEDALRALAAAHEKQPEWASQAPREREGFLRRAYGLMVERVNYLASW